MGKFCFLFVVLLVLHASLCVHGKEPEPSDFIRCRQHEQEALLKFKQSFTSDPMNRLSSWVGEDCCQWHGVTCDNVTHNVVKLNLRSPPPYDDINCLPKPGVSMVSSGVSSALLQLELLTHLDLSGNDFSGSQIPEFVGSMRHLRYLNLSFAAFSGPLPPQLGNLTNLVHLDLNVYGCNIYPWHSEGLGWVSKLSKLQSFDLSGCDLSRAHDTFPVLKTLPSLSLLSLSGCFLSKSHLSKALISNTSNTYFPTLQHLDLQWNAFYSPLPSVLKSMESLRFLNLRMNMLNGSVPLWLTTMRRLEVLDLSKNSFRYVEGGIMRYGCNFKHLDLSDNFISQRDILEPSMSLTGCAAFELQYLDLSDNMMTNVSLPSSLGQLTNLYHLDLSNNMINVSLSSSLGQLTNLYHLDLSNNMMIGSLPSSLGQLTNLYHLDLSHNEFKGPVPTSFVKLTALKYLDLSINEFNGRVPDFIGHLTQIEHLDISRNSLQSLLPSSFVKFSALKFLDLSRNNLSGLIPDSIGHLTQIEYLDISWNSLYGRVPSSFVKFPALKSLDLSGNNLSGLIPDFIGHLPQIEHLDISWNSLQGTVFGIGNLSKLSYLDMNFNNLNLNLDSSFNWRPSFQLTVFNVRSCVINTVFPPWLRNQTQIEKLDLSNTGISGELPAWLWNSAILQYLRLSGNQLTGSLPQHIACEESYCGSSLWWLDLHDNLLSGTIPNWLDNSYIHVIDLSSNQLSGSIFDGNNASLLLKYTYSLTALNLNDNMFSGEIQFLMESPFRQLEILSLRGNHFNGPIPSQLCDIKSLTILVLAHNHFTGHVPPCLGSMSFNGFEILDKILQFEEIVKGIDELFTGAQVYQGIIDLSCNYLVGTIPEELTNISALFALNLSYNHLIGHIPENIGNLKAVESLDLSNNHLSGTIPQSLSSISWLSKLNLSNNNLHGPIPTGNQLQTLDDPSIYTGNSGLCGFPLPNDCTKLEPPTSSTIVNPTAGKDDVEKKDKYGKMWFILAVMSGVATGFWGVVGTLVIKRSWRHTYFRYVEELGDRIYVPIKVRVNRFKRGFTENF